MENYIKVLHGNFTEVCLNDEAKCFFLPIERAYAISTFIRNRYTADDETAIINNHLADQTEEHEAKWAEYQQYRTNIKSAITEIWEDIEAANKALEDAQPKPKDMDAEAANESKE